MPNVLVSNDDLTVLGSPEIVELLVDIGPTGTRGSKIFVGIGDPNLVGIGGGQTPILNDLYINTSPTADYGYLYQYISQPGGTTWVQILKINPTLFSYINETTYNDGVGEIVIPISSITSLTGLSSSNFNVQYSIQNINPVSSSIASVTVVGTDLVISIRAIEYDSGWVDINGLITTYIFISIVL
jgi:hypothetical protein